MTRHILAVALTLGGAACAFDAAAQSNVLYGVLDVSGSRVKPVGGEHRWQLDSNNLQRSFFGFRGAEDLGGGLRAVYKLEAYVRVDTGQTGRTESDTFFSRDANVGLSGAFGTTVLGRNVTPLYYTTINFNPFGEGFGFSPATRQYYGAGGAVLGDRSWNNSISYMNNLADPLRVNVVANLPEGSAGQQGKNYGGSVSYITGPFAAAVAAERIQNSGQGLPTGFDKQNAFEAAATYDFKFVRLYAQGGYVKTEAASDSKTTLYQLGAAVPVGNGVILAAYGHAKAKNQTVPDVTDRTASLAYDYFLSKNTDIYAAALYEKTTSLSSGNSFASGVRVRF